MQRLMSCGWQKDRPPGNPEDSDNGKKTADSG
jgi:hypothetical protein